MSAHQLPLVLVDPSRLWLAVFGAPEPLSIEAASRGVVTVAGIAVHESLRASTRLRRHSSLAFVHIPTGAEVPVDLNGSAWIVPIGFSGDGRFLAFLAADGDGLHVAWVRAGERRVTTLREHRVNACLPDAAAWCGPHDRIVCRFVPARSDPVFAAGFQPLTYDSPSTTITGWNRRGAMTLAGPDAVRANFESSLGIVDVGASTVRPVGDPGVFTSSTPSPDGRWLRVATAGVVHGHSGLFKDLPATEEVWDCSVPERVRVHHLPDLPFEPARHAAAGWRWHPFRPSTIVCCVRSETASLLVHAEPPYAEFSAEPLTADAECVRYGWTTEGRLLTWEHDRRRHALAIRVASDDGQSSVVWRGSILPVDGPDPQWLRPGHAAVDEPVPIWRATIAGELAEELECQLLLTGARVAAGCRHPFLERVDDASGERTEIHTSAAGEHEQVVGVLDDRAQRILTLIESPACPPVIHVVDRGTGRRAPVAASAVTSNWSDVVRRRIEYRSYDGQRLVCSLYDRPRPDGTAPVPTMVWVYPELAGFLPVRDRLADNQFLVEEGVSPLSLLDEGFAVAHFPQLPLRPGAANPEAMTGQLVTTIESLVEGLIEAGADRRRLAIGGHCLGAYAAAQLLAQTTLFRAGVVCGGFYNLTNRPKGWLLTGRRSMQDCLQVYLDGSPLLNADRINAPILIVHGEHDEYLWLDPALESRQLYLAVASAGGTARYVCLPREGHVYQAPDSMAAFRAELAAWCRRYL